MNYKFTFRPFRTMKQIFALSSIWYFSHSWWALLAGILLCCEFEVNR